MDWLILHDAIVNCRRRQIVLKWQNGETVRIESDRFVSAANIISTFSTQKCVRKGCEAYLAYILDTRTSKLKLESIPTINDFADVFPEELLGLLLVRDIDFAIDLVLRTSPISISPYRMAPTKLKELKALLQELSDRGFVLPSFSP
ncbi:Gag protease polyprotein [Gossypium australe]|uniref:Gag protease polyprotein n=1 Tax=Gossypium australe TaxID=47621 RepID=A0A5B6W801_9ROSI|nr:Gag protease polyprotein [Gossypium australe]